MSTSSNILPSIVTEAATFIGIDYHKKYSVYHAVDAVLRGSHGLKAEQQTAEAEAFHRERLGKPQRGVSLHLRLSHLSRCFCLLNQAPGLGTDPKA